MSKTYQVDRIWSRIRGNKHPNSIRVDKYPRHISIANIQDISS